MGGLERDGSAGPYLPARNPFLDHAEKVEGVACAEDKAAIDVLLWWQAVRMISKGSKIASVRLPKTDRRLLLSGTAAVFDLALLLSVSRDK